MELTFESGALLLSIAAVVAMLSRRLRLPYSVGLVAAGIGLALLRGSVDVHLDLVIHAPGIHEEPNELGDWRVASFRRIPLSFLATTRGVAWNNGNMRCQAVPAV